MYTKVVPSAIAQCGKQHSAVNSTVQSTAQHDPKKQMLRPPSGRRRMNEKIKRFITYYDYERKHDRMRKQRYK